MKTKKTTRITEITVETDRLFAVHKSQNAPLAWCPACSEEVRTARPDLAAAIADVIMRELYRRSELGRVHFLEGPGGVLLFCLKALHPNHVTPTEFGKES
jgi:hypothetical protein